MADHTGAVFVDLDRTLLRSASGPVVQEAMVAEGVLTGGRHLPALEAPEQVVELVRAGWDVAGRQAPR